jgi:hypothetical protein
MFFSEHIYLGVRLGVKIALSKIDSPGLQKERAERFLVRKYVYLFHSCYHLLTVAGNIFKRAWGMTPLNWQPQVGLRQERRSARVHLKGRPHLSKDFGSANQVRLRQLQLERTLLPRRVYPYRWKNTADFTRRPPMTQKRRKRSYNLKSNREVHDRRCAPWDKKSANKESSAQHSNISILQSRNKKYLI